MLVVLVAEVVAKMPVMAVVGKLPPCIIFLCVCLLALHVTSWADFEA